MTATTCDRCGTVLDRPSSADLAPETPYQAGYIVELRAPSQSPVLARGGSLAGGQIAAESSAPQADEADCCLRCKQQGPGAHYSFFVAMKQSLSHQIVHEEKVFLCDRCAQARVRFAPLVVLLFWVPALALVAVFVFALVLRDWRMLITLGIGTRARWLGMPWRLMVLLGLLFLIAVLVRLASRQLRAIRHRLFHRLPYSGSVVLLAIQLRKKELLRSLHLNEKNALFLMRRTD
jgi:hypothetical protein